ncbi:MAG: VWA domain-containing protein [Candidatus Hermodarchaeota archaeon]
MSLMGLKKNSRLYLETIKRNKGAVALILLATVTLPLFAFTALPPLEVTEEIPIEVPVEEEIPVTITVNQTVVINNTVQLNITEGGSVLLEPLPIPQFIDSDIVLCIDLSGSMNSGSPTRIDITKNAIHNFLDVLESSANINQTQDRVSLVTYYGSRDGYWFNDATEDTTLDFVSNATHLEDVRNKTDALTPYMGANTYTDIWAGLNYSLNVLLNNQRATPALKLILLLTDGGHNTGPWAYDVSDNNFTGFLRLQPNESIYYNSTTPTWNNTEGGIPNSSNPIIQAKANGVQIYSVAMQISDGSWQEEFLHQISDNPENGTGGKFFDGDDTFNLTDAFITARDEASGWSTFEINLTSIIGTGTRQIFEFNVTEDLKRFKWDINWNTSSVDFNLTIVHPSLVYHPNGSVTNLIIHITNDSLEGITPFINRQPKTVYFDFPATGIWKFNITWANIPTDELVKSRLSSFDPPIFINSVTQLNTTANNSVLFAVNTTNKNPFVNYTNVTPHVLTNFQDVNMTQDWNPDSVAVLETDESVVFELNLTFLEPIRLQGNLIFKVNSSEGYYDAYAQPIVLDYRIFTQNITVETYTSYQTVISTSYDTSFGVSTTYAYNVELLNTLKWAGLLAILSLLLAFLGLYIKANQIRLKRLVSRFNERLFPDRTVFETALQKEGITLAPGDIEFVMADADSIDRLGQNIFELTGQKLAPETLVKVVSGADTDKIAQRLSYVTGIPQSQILLHLKEASSVDDLMARLDIDKDRFLDIISLDEDVISFQEKISGLMTYKPSKISGIEIFEDLDVDRFRSRIKRS